MNLLLPHSRGPKVSEPGLAPLHRRTNRRLWCNGFRLPTLLLDLSQDTQDRLLPVPRCASSERTATSQHVPPTWMLTSCCAAVHCGGWTGLLV